MQRMGHDSMRAALIYQHATQGADRKIADAMEALIVQHERQAEDVDEQVAESASVGALDARGMHAEGR